MLAYSIPLVASFFEATDRAAVLLKHRPEIRTGRLFVRRHRSTDWFLRHAPLPLGFAVVKLPDFNCGQKFILRRNSSFRICRALHDDSRVALKDNASRQILTADVRFGSKADIAECETNVRFAPKSGH
jgi:hypothetical protein